jgi:hypothetical protein
VGGPAPVGVEKSGAALTRKDSAFLTYDPPWGLPLVRPGSAACGDARRRFGAAALRIVAPRLVASRFAGSRISAPGDFATERERGVVPDIRGKKAPRAVRRAGHARCRGTTLRAGASYWRFRVRPPTAIIAETSRSCAASSGTRSQALARLENSRRSGEWPGGDRGDRSHCAGHLFLDIQMPGATGLRGLRGWRAANASRVRHGLRQLRRRGL